jgi:protein-S-isoprenylcysteine O-methyltransferase Ste14
MNSVHRQALRGLAIYFLVTAVLLFTAAGTLDYWQAWTYLAIFFSASLAITFYLVKKDPALLARRMSGGPFAEKEPVQKIIMSLVSIGFIGLTAFPAIDHRFGWSHVPLYGVVASRSRQRDCPVRLARDLLRFPRKQFQLRDH